MQRTILYVEGTLDAELLFLLFGGTPLVLSAGSKNALAPVVFREREKTNLQHRVFYLRDRDFDYDPPADFPDIPQEDRKDNSGRVLGWRWCRHEMENYLLDPVLACASLGMDAPTYERFLLSSAERILYYEASRWALGKARRSLPPSYEFRTRPDSIPPRVEFYLPEDLSEEMQRGWMIEQTNTFSGRIFEALDVTRIEEDRKCYQKRLKKEGLNGTSGILLWFSGKDLLKAMTQEQSCARAWAGSPKCLRRCLLEEARKRKDILKDLFPEWEALSRCLSSEGGDRA